MNSKINIFLDVHNCLFVFKYLESLVMSKSPVFFKVVRYHRRWFVFTKSLLKFSLTKQRRRYVSRKQIFINKYCLSC